MWGEIVTNLVIGGLGILFGLYALFQCHLSTKPERDFRRQTDRIRRLKREKVFFAFDYESIIDGTNPVCHVEIGRFVRVALRREVQDWCERSCEDGPLLEASNGMAYVFFTNQDDAVAFKLRWL